MPLFRRRREPQPPTVSEPTEAELQWLEANHEIARALADAVGLAGVDVLEPANLDRVFAAWLEQWQSLPEEDRDDPNPYINGVGIAFGQALVDRLGMRWVVASDEEGTELAVHRDPGDVLVYPPNLVAKRFVERETGFLEPLFDELEAHLRELG